MLEPLVFRLHVLRDFLIRTEKTRGGEPFARRIQYWWWDYPDPEPSLEVLELLKQLPSLPPLSKSSAVEWSRRIIVPLIMPEHAPDSDGCSISVLAEIWRHRSVKSRATFESRLHSRVLDTLRRYAREEGQTELRGTAK